MASLRLKSKMNMAQKKSPCSPTSFFPYEVTTNEFVIKDVEIYKLRQVLALSKLNQRATFIVQPLASFTEGTVSDTFEGPQGEKLMAL